MAVPGASLVPILLLGLGTCLAASPSPKGKGGWLQCLMGGGGGGSCRAVMVAEDRMWGHVDLFDPSGACLCSWLNAAVVGSEGARPPCGLRMGPMGTAPGLSAPQP